MKRTGKAKNEGRWPLIRTGVITFFVVFNILAAIPSPGHITKAKLQRPIAQAELERWVAFFDGLGIETTSDGLADWYVGFSRSVEGVKWKVLTPITWWMDLMKAHQGWRLFGTPDERPFALKVVVVRGGKKEVIYQSGEAQWRSYAGLLQFRRVRGLYNPGRSGPPNTYNGFTKRLAARILEDHPDVDEVHISAIRSHTTLPGEPPDPTISEHHRRVIKRDKK